MIVTGYHGTTAEAADRIDTEGFKATSGERYKWLGYGIYFFQDAPQHAWNWARATAARRKSSPILFQAELSLDRCLDLVDGRHWPALKNFIDQQMVPFPGRKQIGPEGLFRAVATSEGRLGFNYEDDYYIEAYTAFAAPGTFTTIRAPLPEGRPWHERSWLLDQSHVAICVKDKSAIRTVQRVRGPMRRGE